MAAHLSYGRVNLNILREAARKELREFLDKCAGSKVMDTQTCKTMARNSDSKASFFSFDVNIRLPLRCYRVDTNHNVTVYSKRQLCVECWYSLTTLTLAGKLHVYRL